MTDPDPQGGGTPPADTTTATAEDIAGLKSALAKEREGRKAALLEAKRVGELEAELAKFREASQTEAEKALDAARKETESTVRAEVTRERVLDKIEVKAAGKFADPEDAQLRLAGRAADFVRKDGSIDAEAIDAALTELLEQKPHLAAGAARRFNGSADQGVRDSGTPDVGPGKLRLMQAYATPKP